MSFIRSIFFVISSGLVIYTFISCEDFAERDITRSEVNVLAPKEDVVYSDTLVSFFWDPLKGATSYHLQVFKPSYKLLSSVCYDTIVTVNLLMLPLESGEYEWRIKGDNSYYNTDYFYNKFLVQNSLE